MPTPNLFELVHHTADADVDFTDRFNQSDLSSQTQNKQQSARAQ